MNCDGSEGGSTVSGSDSALVCPCCLPPSERCALARPSVMWIGSSWELLWRRRPAAGGGARLIATTVRDPQHRFIRDPKKKAGLQHAAIAVRMRILKYHVKMKSRSSVKPRSRASALLRKKRIERIHRRKSLRRYGTCTRRSVSRLMCFVHFRRSPSLRSQTEVDTDCTMSVDVKQRERREREEKGGEEGDGEAVGEGDLDVSVGEESAEIESSGSDDEEGREGEEVSEAAAHSRLLSAITSLGRQRRCGQRSEATPTASQYQLTSHAGGE